MIINYTMDKILFSIPEDTHETLSDTHETLSDKHETLSDKHETLSDKHETLSDKHETLSDKHETLSDKSNQSHYVKISPNVYKFGKNNSDNIYILYNEACEIKNKNKYNAIQLFKKCYELINNSTKQDIIYEININLALLLSEIKDVKQDEIYNYYDEALKIYPDRAEPYYYCSIYCNKINDYKKSYDLLHKALLLSYEDVKIKYASTQFSAYGKYLYDNLSIACYWLQKYEEGYYFIVQIINDPDFNYCKQRLTQNFELIKTKLSH